MPKPNTAATEPACEKANAATADTARNTLSVFLRPQISTSHAARKYPQLRDGDGQRIAE